MDPLKACAASLIIQVVLWRPGTAAAASALGADQIYLKLNSTNCECGEGSPPGSGSEFNPV